MTHVHSETIGSVSKKRFTSVRYVLPLVMVAGLVAIASEVSSQRTPSSVVHLSHTALTSATSVTQSLQETYGGSNPVETCGTCDSWGTSQSGTATPPATSPGDLVNTATGDVNESYTLFSAPSVGNDFFDRLSYDSQYAISTAGNAYAGAYGWGWSSNNNSAEFDTVAGSTAGATVMQGTGAQAQFYQEVDGACPSTPANLVPGQYGTDTPIYCAKPDVNADFIEWDSYGDYTLYQDGGLTNETFLGDGVLDAEGTSVFPALLQLSYGIPIGSGCLQNSLGQVSTCDVTTDALTGRFYSTGFSLDGLAVQTEDPAGNVWDYGYSGVIGGVPKSNNELTSITDPDGHSWTFGYDNTAPTDYIYGLTDITDPDGHTTTLTYFHSGDSLGMVSEVADAMSPVDTTSYAYTNTGCGSCVTGSQQTTVSDSNGNVANLYYFYLLIYQQTQSTDITSSPYYGKTNTTSYTDSWSGSPLETTQTTQEPPLPQDAAGTGPYVTYVTSGVGDLLSQEIQPISGSSTTSTTNYGYNSFNEVCWEALPGVSISGASCASAPTGSTHKTYNTDGDLLSSTDPVGNVTNYGYNTDGQMCWMTLPDQSPGSGPSCTSPPPGASTYEYNVDNELLGSSTPDGSSPSYTHDYTVNSYNGYGEVLTTISPDGFVAGNTTAEYTTTNTYDTAGRLYQISTPYTSSSMATTTATLDAAGNVLNVTDGAGLVTTNQYDNDNRRCWTVPAAETTSPACGSAPTGATSSSYHGGTSDVSKVTDPNGNSTTTTYLDPFFADSPTTVTDATGDVTSNVYDLGGNLCISGSASTSLWGSTVPSCASTSGYTYKSYDQFSNVTQSTDPSSNTTSYSYTNPAYPSSVTITTPPSPDAVTTYAYDTDGELTNTRQGNAYISAAYTPTGNVCWRTPTLVVSPSCSSPPTSISTTVGTSFYGYFASELSATMQDVASATTENDTAWEYDAQGQETQGANNGGTVTYAYNPAGDDTCVGYPLTTADYVDNCQDLPGLQSNGTINAVVDYTYDADGRMTGLAPWTGTAGDLAFGYGGSGGPYEARNEVTTVAGLPIVSDASESLTYDAADNFKTETVEK
jgi:YD repeat-containing protein